MERTWRIVRRLLFLFVTLVVASNTIAFVILNNPYVHAWMRSEVNSRFFSKYGLVFDVGTISVNFLETKIVVQDIHIVDAQSSTKHMFDVDTLTLGFDPWNPVLSWVPRARFLHVDGVEVDLHLQTYVKSDQAEPSKPPADVFEILDTLRLVVGNQFELKNAKIKNSEDLQSETSVKIESLFLKFNSDSNRDGLTLLSEFGGSRFCLPLQPPCQHLIPLDGVSLSASFFPGQNIVIERTELRGLLGSWKISGALNLTSDLRFTDYRINVAGESEAAPWFKLSQTEGGGRYSANVRIQPDRKNSDTSKHFYPRVDGQVSWNALKLSGYDIYSATADVSFSDQKISYQNANIITPTGAKLEAWGEYSLTGNMPYTNFARMVNMPFAELMGGLTVPTEAVNFTMNSNLLKVSGEIQPEKGRGFVLVAQGDIRTTKFSVPGFEQSQYELPDCQIALQLETDSHAMTFAGSDMFCLDEYNQPSITFDLQKGLIDYKKSTNDFRFTGLNLPAEVISYFVGHEMSGSLNLRASITSSRDKPVLFRSEVQANAGEIYSLIVPRVSGIIEIDKKGFRGFGLEAWLEDERESPNMTASQINIGFKSKVLELDGKFDGSVAQMFSILDQDADRFDKNVSGDVQMTRLRIRGNISDFLNSAIDVRMRFRNLRSSTLNARDLQAAVTCQQGWCSGSRIYGQEVFLGDYLNNKAKSADLSSAGLARSKLILEIDSVSNKSIAMRTDLQSIPFAWTSENGMPIVGKFDLRGHLQGGWRDWEMSLTGRVDGLTFGDRPLGGIFAAASSYAGGSLNLVLSGLFDQIQARVVFDHALEKSSQIYLGLRSFELFKYIPGLNKGDLRTTGAVSAELTAEGGGLKTFLKNWRSALGNLSGRGQVSKMRVQFGSEGFLMNDPTLLQLSRGTVSMAPLFVKGSTGQMRLSGSYSLVDTAVAASFDGQLDAALATNFSNLVSQSSGSVNLRGQLSVDSEETQLSGEARLDNVFLAGKYFSPPLNAINGRMILRGSTVEIPALTASKGNGQLDLVGTIDLQPNAERPMGDQMPSVALRANMKGAQFRWPQNFFETVETNLDGQLELSGQDRPYLLSGDLRLTKGRAYRDATCQELWRTGSAGTADASISSPTKPLTAMNIGIEADNSFTLQTSCIRGRVSAALRVAGTDVDPLVSGQIRLDNGQLSLLKTRFEVTRADASFDNLTRIEPRLDAQMVAKIERYSVFVGAEGPLSRPRLNIWSDPSTGPDGMPLSRPTLIRMISTNRGPGETTQTAVTQALANGVVGFFDDPLSQAVSRITRGFVDRFELQPIVESGQSSLRARVSRDLGEKFNLGLDFEPNSQSLTGELIINESVNVLGGFDRRSSQIGTYSELKGGFRFQFGGK